MYRLWLEFLRFLSYLRLPGFAFKISAVNIGKPEDTDIMQSMRWKNFTRAESLYSVWGPHQQSVWLPYHCITLFAAIDRFRPEQIGPVAVDTKQFSFLIQDPAPHWATTNTWIIVDLEGPQSVAVSAWLASIAGYQVVCTFDNWPNQAGLIKPERVLGSLLYFSPFMAEKRKNIQPNFPPLWICDRGRLGLFPGKPRDFDNRYFLDDSVLPGPLTLRRAGITRVVYVSPADSSDEVQDLSLYFKLLVKEGFELLKAPISSRESFLNPVPLIPSEVQLFKGGFFRSSEGGFGRPIPEPSSSSG